MLKFRELLITAAFTLLTGSFALQSSAIASTPDGETPANEGVCDVLMGATPGLYGLCVAYCEAQDLDTFDKNPPSTKILANYNKKKTDGDPDMPCVQAPCPCWSADELASVSMSGASCAAIGNQIQIRSAIAFHQADADTTQGRERCRYIDVTSQPPVVRTLTITPDEAQTCYGQISTACAALP